MNLKARLRRIEKQFRPRTSGLPVPRICIVLVNSRASCLNPGPIKWGTVPGLAEIFERGPEESQDDFVHRLMDLDRTVEHPPGYISCVTIHAETMKPELSAA